MDITLWTCNLTGRVVIPEFGARRVAGIQKEHAQRNGRATQKGLVWTLATLCDLKLSYWICGAILEFGARRGAGIHDFSAGLIVCG